MEMQTFILHGPSRSRAGAEWHLAVMKDYVAEIDGKVTVERIEGSGERSVNAFVIFERFQVPELSWWDYLDEREQEVRRRTGSLPYEGDPAMSSRG